MRVTIVAKKVVETMTPMKVTRAAITMPIW
jgi:hypothetical protein